MNYIILFNYFYLFRSNPSPQYSPTSQPVLSFLTILSLSIALKRFFVQFCLFFAFFVVFWFIFLFPILVVETRCLAASGVSTVQSVLGVLNRMGFATVVAVGRGSHPAVARPYYRMRTSVHIPLLIWVWVEVDFRPPPVSSSVPSTPPP